MTRIRGFFGNFAPVFMTVCYYNSIYFKCITFGDMKAPNSFCGGHMLKVYQILSLSCIGITNCVVTTVIHRATRLTQAKRDDKVRRRATRLGA